MSIAPIEWLANNGFGCKPQDNRLWVKNAVNDLSFKDSLPKQQEK